jgi:hypothetical protein
MKYVSFLFAALFQNISRHDKYLTSYVQLKLETHTEAREIDFYCVLEAVCISSFQTKQVHFFVIQISYSTLAEGATHFEQDRIAVNFRPYSRVIGLNLRRINA